MQVKPAQTETKRRPKLYYGWILVGVFALCHFTESAEVYPVLAVLLKPMTEEFGWSRTFFSGATSIGSFLGGLVGPFLGPVVDKYGPKWILLISFAILGALFCLMAAVQEGWHFYAIQIASRFVAFGLINLALCIIIPNWFIKKRARAIAIGGMGGRLGNSITPIYVQALVSLYSWRVATVTAGLVILVFTLLPIALFIKRRPEDMGLLPDGMTPEEAQKEKEALAKVRTNGGTRQAEGSVAGDVSFTLKEVLRMPSFYMLMGANVTGTLVGPSMNLHMVPYFTDKGLSAEMAVAVTTTLFLTSAVGTLIGAWLTERFGIKNVTVVDGVFMGAWFFFLIAVNSVTMAFVWAVTQGILQGASMTARQVLFPDYYGRKALGTIRGVMTPVNLTFNAIGPTLTAFAFDMTGSYTAIFLVFGALRVISGLFVYWAKPPEGSMASVGRSYWKKGGGEGGGGGGH